MYGLPPQLKGAWAAPDSVAQCNELHSSIHNLANLCYKHSCYKSTLKTDWCTVIKQSVNYANSFITFTAQDISLMWLHGSYIPTTSI